MDHAYANEILACLSRERTCYHYFKDRYALQLLGYAAGGGASIAGLRRSPFARLLNKPIVRHLIADCSDGRVSRERLDAHWEDPLLPFLLTVGLWGHRYRWRWMQTSRPGFNLVLRLNFNHQHDSRFKALFNPYYRHDSLNRMRTHPIMKDGERYYYRQTLAWARLDLDLERGEALIEEIQTDWVRQADAIRSRLPDCANCADGTRDEHCGQVAKARAYLDEVLQPYARVWDEAMLSAALFFLREELGLTRIWLHTWASGNALKRIDNDWAPPRSLYRQLPRRFCFQETDDMPAILHNRASEKRLRRAGVQPRFHQLNI